MKIEADDLKDRRRARNVVRRSIRRMGKMIVVDPPIEVDDGAEVERDGNTMLVRCVVAGRAFLTSVPRCALPR